MTTVYDRRGRVVHKTYYWSPEEARLAAIRNSLEGPANR
jgi:hypothetical protein